MPSIASLPRELISLILELSIDQRHDAPTETRWTANQLLRNASVVCRAWRAPAQQLLWADVELSTNRSAKLFCHSWLAPMPVTRTLTLEDDGETAAWEEGIAEGVLSACRGLREVRLRTLCFPSTAALCWGNLSGVTSLSLEELQISRHTETAVEFDNCSFPLHLNKLDLAITASLPPSLLSAFLQPSLTSLTLSIFPPFQANNPTHFDFIESVLIPFLATVFPNLTTFHSGISPEFELLFRSIFSLLRRLQRIVCDPMELGFMPATLKTWTTWAKDLWNDDGMLERIAMALRSLPSRAKLEKLVVHVGSWGPPEEKTERPWVDQLEEECRRRKIALVLRGGGEDCPDLEIDLNG